MRFLTGGKTVLTRMQGLQCSVLLGVLFLFATPLQAGDADNAGEVIDESHDGEVFVENRGQWVPVPLVISNPTVGTGLQGVLMYLHPQKPGSTHNTTTGIVGMYTNTDSWFTGLFHDDDWKNDTIRFSGFIGTGEFNLDFYGIGEGGIIRDNPIPYEFDITVAVLKPQIRVPITGLPACST
jgi:hypothetical protein